MLWLLALCLLGGVSGQCRIRCADFHREGCPQTEDAVCSSCFLNYTGALSGNTNCTPILPCIASTTCQGHGVCRSDQSCGCDPDWYGADCSSPIGAGSWSDTNLAGAIIAWLLMVPVLIALTFYCFKAQTEGKFEDWKDRFLDWVKEKCARPASSASTPAARAPIAKAGSTKQGAKHSPTARDDVEMQATDSDSKTGLMGEPANMDELVKQIIEIVPRTTPQAAREALRKHDYNVGAALPSLMH